MPSELAYWCHPLRSLGGCQHLLDKKHSLRAWHWCLCLVDGRCIAILLWIRLMRDVASLQPAPSGVLYGIMGQLLLQHEMLGPDEGGTSGCRNLGAGLA